MDRRIGLIGTGIMGEPMGRRWLRAGYELIVHNRTRARAERLLAEGAQWADTPADLASRADVVVTNVPDSPDVEAVLLGEHGAIEGLRPGMLVIDHSTISPHVTRRIAARLGDLGVAFLDAPVSGGQWGAQEGRLSIMVGGDEAALARARPLLEVVGTSITHCGPVGTGQATKLCNQILCAGHLLAACEAIVFARKNGLNVERMLQAVRGGAAGSWVLEHLAPRMLRGDFAPGFFVDWQQKDLRLVMQAARQVGAALPGTALAQELLASNQAHGEGREGTQALIKVLERLNNLAGQP